MPLHATSSPPGKARSELLHGRVTDESAASENPISPLHVSSKAMRSTERLLADLKRSGSPYFSGRSERVAELAARIAGRLGLDAVTVEHVRLAGRLHDIGMSRIREDVLRKPGVLTPAEIRHVREHVGIGVELLAPHLGQGPILDFIRDHHERFDGSGYPRGLAGSEISRGGQILMAADAFDALTSQRPYREPLSSNAALSRLAGDAGRALDPEVYSALRSVVQDGALGTSQSDARVCDQGGTE